MGRMRIAIVDESAARASVIQDGLAALPDCELFIVTGRHGLVARIGEIEPDIVLMDLGNPSRDVLEEYFAVSRALDRPIAMFVDESDEDSIAASVDAGVSAYVVDGLSAHRIRPLLDLAVRRFNAFARLQADLAEAKGKLAERETIDLAKRILMDSRGLPEPKAYAEMRSAAMSQGKRIADIAEAIVTADRLLSGKSRGEGT
jgi:two-component system, response regulator / RNA-binding antiterminator